MQPFTTHSGIAAPLLSLLRRAPALLGLAARMSGKTRSAVTNPSAIHPGVIQGLSFAVQDGQSLALLGRNGVGKTTLIDSLIGVTTHFGGAIISGAGR